MPTVLQLRRGTTAQNNAFTGSAGELTFNTSTGALRAHDGTTAGGAEMLVNTGSNANISQSVTLTGAVTGSGTITNLGDLTIATTATNDPTITLAGDLTGSCTLTNLGNATLTATIAANSVALGTDTTGNYMSNISAGTGISVSHTPGEGSTGTIALSHLGIQSLSDPLADRILMWDSSAGASAWLTVGSNLTLSGTTLSADTQAPVAGTGISVSGTTVSLGTSGVTAGSYGSSSAVPVLTVDAYGRITSASTASITTDLSIASDLGTGTISLASETMTVTGGTNANTSISGNTITVNVDSSPSFGGNVTIAGNLTVNGTVTTVATTNTTISDSLIELNSGAASNASDLGIVMERGLTGDNAFIGWDESADKFIVGTTTATGSSTGDLVITAANLTVATPVASTDAATKGYVDSAVSTSPVITLAGDLSGSCTLTNLGSATLTATIAANSVALGTDTTGNYVAAGATSGNGISGSVSSEGGTFTVTSNATNANTASTIVFRDASGNFSAGTISANLTGNVTGNVTGSSGSCTGNAATATNATNAANVQVDADNLTNATHYITFSGAATGNNRLNSDTGLTYNPSTNTLSTSIFSGTSTTARYADLAENYIADEAYSAGTVVAFGGDAEVTVANTFASRNTAGVVSTNPAHLMNSELTGDTVVALALAGRVPCRVVGVVRKGDLMVASNTPGCAIAWGEELRDPPAGSIIGKALEDKSGQGEGIIEVVVGVR